MSSFAVLWLNRDDLEALELMSEITKRLKERELKTASKETVFIYKNLFSVLILMGLFTINLKSFLKHTKLFSHPEIYHKLIVW